MPIIASFFGIYVRMYFADHGPPHMHVAFLEHRPALQENWARAQSLQPLSRIPGADHD